VSCAYINTHTTSVAAGATCLEDGVPVLEMRAQGTIVYRSLMVAPSLSGRMWFALGRRLLILCLLVCRAHARSTRCFGEFKTLAQGLLNQDDADVVHCEVAHRMDIEVGLWAEHNYATCVRVDVCCLFDVAKHTARVSADITFHAWSARTTKS
jgi:hypothetical protein